MTESQRLFRSAEPQAFADLMCGFRDDSDDRRDASLSDEGICRKYGIFFFRQPDGIWTATWDGSTIPLLLDPKDGWVA